MLRRTNNFFSSTIKIQNASSDTDKLLLTRPLLLREIGDHQWEKIENLVNDGEKTKAFNYYCEVVQNPHIPIDKLKASFENRLRNRGIDLSKTSEPLRSKL
jgi:hypothetical protein